MRTKILTLAMALALMPVMAMAQSAHPNDNEMIETNLDVGLTAATLDPASAGLEQSIDYNTMRSIATSEQTVQGSAGSSDIGQRVPMISMLGATNMGRPPATYPRRWAPPGQVGIAGF